MELSLLSLSEYIYPIVRPLSYFTENQQLISDSLTQDLRVGYVCLHYDHVFSLRHDHLSERATLHLLPYCAADNWERVGWISHVSSFEIENGEIFIFHDTLFPFQIQFFQKEAQNQFGSSFYFSLPSEYMAFVFVPRVKNFGNLLVETMAFMTLVKGSSRLLPNRLSSAIYRFHEGEVTPIG
jgi:hypothetical protein